MRRALLAASVLAFSACSGGLMLQEGNAFPCHFDQDPGVRDQACPSGWICGVSNVCQEDKPEGLPAGLTPPGFDGQGQIAPRVAREAVTGLATTPSSKYVFASFTDFGDWLFHGSFGVPVGTTPFLAGAVSEPPDGNGFLLSAPSATKLVTLGFDGGVSVATVKEPISGFRSASVFGAGSPVAVQTTGASGARVFQAGADGQLGMAMTSADGGAVLDLRQVGGTIFDLTSGSIASVSLVESTASDGGVAAALTSPVDSHLLSEAPDPTSPVCLQHSASADLWAVSYFVPVEGQKLAAFVQSSASDHRFVPAIDPCRPCPIGQVVAMVPVSSQPVRVEVLCANLTGVGPAAAPQFYAVTAGGADPQTGVCAEEPFTATMSEREITAVDVSVGGFIAFGGAHGEIWSGPSISAMKPRLLDRIPDGLGTMNLVDDSSGAVHRLPLAFTGSYFAVDLGSVFGTQAVSDGYAVIDPSQAAHGPPAGVEPRAAVARTDGWLIGSDAILAHITLHEQDPSGAVLNVQGEFGPQLLGPSGAQAQPPFLATTTRDEQSFLISSGDSLYLYENQSPTPYPGQLPPLTPQLTPQSGFPIRSLTVDRSDGQSARIHGYAVTSNTLYEFQLGGAPEHWSGHQIVLSGNEPVKVWMQDDHSPYGRVGYRDGTLFTLPDGLPLATPLRQPDGGADRVLDYANFGGWPVAATTSGLYVAAPEDGGVPTTDGGTELLSWHKITLADGGEPWAGQNGKLDVRSEGDGGVTLRFFADHGFIFQVGHARE